MSEDINGVIKSCKSQKDRQCNGQKKKEQKDKQWFTKHYAEKMDWATWTPLTTGMNTDASKA